MNKNATATDSEATDETKAPTHPLRHPTLVCVLAAAVLYIIGFVLLIIKHSLKYDMFQDNGFGTMVYVPNPNAWLETVAIYWLMLPATALVVFGLVYGGIMKWRGQD